jgi:tRNA modification GTPase
MTHDIMVEKVGFVIEEVDKLLRTAGQGKILREGLATAIIGRPNVGKSSLMNSLVHENKAIVTDIPGTTRDTLEEYVNVRGVPLRLVDTAGIRETEDIVERLGVERSRKALREADLILLVVNHGEELSPEDEALFEATADMNAVVIVNKVDVPRAINLERVNELAAGRPGVTTAFIEDKGLEDLEEAIAALFFEGAIEGEDATYVSNTRHIALLEQAKQTAQDALEATDLGMPIDLIQIDVTRTWELLGEIIGDSVQDSLIDQLFSQFCLGK